MFGVKIVLVKEVAILPLFGLGLGLGLGLEFGLGIGLGLFWHLRQNNR